MNNKKEKGITLIALVVTIVILLILAGISMTMVIGENGIITKAKDARENQVHSAVKEGIILSHNQYTIEDGTGERDSTTFKDYIEGKGIIDENGIINVVNLLGKKQHLGNGSDTETGDVYVFEESDDVYRVKYYDEKKEEHLIDEFEKGSTGEDGEETDPSLFEVDDDGKIHLKDANKYYSGALKWTEENLVIPEEVDGKTVTTIDGVFTQYMTLTLKSVKIPSTVTKISSGTFNGLSRIQVSEENSVYDSRDNSNAIIETATNTLITGSNSTVIPDSVKSIGDSAFYDCNELTSIVIPNGVTSIGSFTFYNCNELTGIVIPESVTSIGDFAFEDCRALTSITIPDSVNYIGKNAFWYCENLISIVLPKGITKIYYSTFSGCTNLINVTIPNSVTEIDNHAFAECSSLINIEIPDSVTSIGDYAFQYCTALTSIVIPDSVTNIGSEAFEGCASLESVTIPSSITILNGRLFRGCSKLNNVTIPKEVTLIYGSVFENCNSLTTINYTGTEEEWKQIKVYSGNNALTDANIVYNYIPSN